VRDPARFVTYFSIVRSIASFLIPCVIPHLQEHLFHVGQPQLGGVRSHAFDGTNEKAALRYKLFNNPVLREVVFNRLKAQLVETGFCGPDPSVALCLACGHIPSEGERAKLQNHFAQGGWILWDETWLRGRLRAMSAGNYENQISAVVAKLLLRGTVV
jgi:hypothetical protein